MIKKVEYKGLYFWITVEQTKTDDSYYAYVSDKEPKSFNYGALIRDGNGIAILFPNAHAAFTNARMLLENEINSTHDYLNNLMTIEGMILGDFKAYSLKHRTQTFEVKYVDWGNTYGLYPLDFTKAIKNLEITGQIKIESESLETAWYITIL